MQTARRKKYGQSEPKKQGVELDEEGVRFVSKITEVKSSNEMGTAETKMLGMKNIKHENQK